jgi:hypothetical protein
MIRKSTIMDICRAGAVMSSVAFWSRKADRWVMSSSHFITIDEERKK